MKPKNLVLRRRLAYVESQLETECVSSRHSPRLKQDRQRRLEEEKIAIQKSLESVVYPILTIPFEITAEIFLHCLPAFPSQPSGSVAPMLLARICRQWRNIACSTPRLWAALRVYRWEGPNLALLVPLWCRRAGVTPKSLFLDLPFRRCPEPFFRTTDRCQCCPSSLIFTQYWAHLTSFRGTNFTPAECLALFSHTPRLTHCTFDDIKERILPSTSTSRVILANLEHFSLQTYPLQADSLLPLLNSITCPALGSFSISAFFHDFTDTLLPFLEKAPYMKVLTIKFFNSSTAILTPILHAVPALTSLHLVANDTVTFHFLHVLGASATFLPHVTKITLLPYTRIIWTDSQVTTWIDAITSRWEARSIAQLLDFEYVVPWAFNTPLDDRIIACASALKEKGMRIHVHSG